MPSTTDAYARLESAIQDWIREDAGTDLVLTDWTLAAASIDMSTAGEEVSYSVGGSGAPHAVLGLASLGVVNAKARLEGDDDG